MKQIRWKGAIWGILLSGVMAGCTQYDSEEQAVTAGEERGERPTFGSATDIMQEDGVTPTNAANKADIGIGGPVQSELGNFESQPLPGQQSDTELAKQIRVALTTGSMGTTGTIAENQLTKIQVSAQNGIVTLAGPVASEQEKEIIEQRVTGMKGVRGVKNELTVTGKESNVPLNPLTPRTPGNQAESR